MLSFADAIRRMGEMSLLIGESEADTIVCADLDETVHLFVSGVTGSGKSVFLDSILLSLILRNKPDRLRLILYDSKMVDLMRYSGEAHLLLPVITSPEKLEDALRWAEMEVLKRLSKLAAAGKRTIDQYNSICQTSIIPRILIVIDDLTHAIVDCPSISSHVLQILSKGRAVGVHLIIIAQSTSQKPINEIASYIPSKVVFLTLTEKESRFLLRNSSACQLEQFGSAIFSPTIGRSEKVKTIMASESESDMIIAIGRKMAVHYDESVIISPIKEIRKEADAVDELFPDAVDVIMETGMASPSMLQRRLKLGYSRAIRLIDQMEQKGYVGPFEGAKPRRILITRNQWNAARKELI